MVTRLNSILGRSEASAEQLAAYLLSVNPEPKISIPVRQFCQLFIDVAAKEGVRGDVLFAQSCKETGNFKFRGTVKADQNNYAGLGTTNKDTPGACFPDEATGILAQAQHAKAYATISKLCNPCVDPRYSLILKYGKSGTARYVEELGGKWAVPGYSTSKYASLEDANKAKDSYGYQIIAILEKILSMPKEEKIMSKIIAIDAGHGMSTSGKRCMKALDPSETREWYLNDRIADRLQELLSGYDCKTIRVDDTTGVKDVPLATRVRTANNAKADVYLSIHHNAGMGGRIGGGTVVFYCSTNPDRLTQARRMYQSVINNTGLIGDRSSTVIYKRFYVIKNTNMPAFLIENGFMDSQSDIKTILSASHAEKTAQGLLKFLVEQFCLEPKGIQIKPTESQTSIYYPAYSGKKTTLIAALTSLGIVSTYAHRKQIADTNGITGYMGTAAQNTQMYNMLTAGLLKKVR